MDGKVTVFKEDTGGTNGLMFGPDGRLYGCQTGRQRVVAYATDGAESVVASDIRTNDIAITAEGSIYVTDPRDKRVWFIDTKGNKVQVAKAYYLVGHILSWEAGDWNTGTLPNLMVYDGGNNYSKVIKVIKGTSEKAPDFQFATSDWATAWTGAKALAVGTEGKLAAAHMANESVAIAATGSYLVTFNPVALTVKFTALP